MEYELAIIVMDDPCENIP